MRYQLVELFVLELLRKDLNVYFGIEGGKRLLRRLYLLGADGVGAIEDLALQVGEVDLVGIGEGEPAETARREIKRGRAAETAGADDQR